MSLSSTAASRFLESRIGSHRRVEVYAAAGRREIRRSRWLRSGRTDEQRSKRIRMRARAAQEVRPEMGRLGAADPSSGRGGDLQLRPVRPADRERIIEITKDVWEGRDYIPRVFDSWVAGGDPARIPDPAEAKKLWPGIASSAGFELYAGVCPDMNGARDLDADELERLARNGLVRLGPGGRAVALLREPWGQNIAVSLLAGRGGALRELLMALRFEADADGLNHVTINLPPGHPAEEDLKATGYDFADAEHSAYIYALTL